MIGGLVSSYLPDITFNLCHIQHFLAQAERRLEQLRLSAKVLCQVFGKNLRMPCYVVNILFRVKSG